LPQFSDLSCQASFCAASKKVIICLTRKNTFKVLLCRSTTHAIDYRAKQVSMSQPGRCQGFDEIITQIVVFRAIELKSLLLVQLAF